MQKSMQRQPSGVRKTSIDWDYNGDGMFKHERIKGKDKRFWRRWRRRMAKQSIIKDSLIDDLSRKV